MGNTEVEYFVKQMESNLNRAYQGTIVLTHFLDEQQQQQIKEMNRMDVNITMEGGFKDCERKRTLFYPVGLKNLSYKIKVFQICYNPRYLNLHHRKVLGALLSLGIKRESIGDIVFIEDKVYFACTEEISAYIVASFKTIGGVPIELIEEKEVLTAKKELREETHIVSSMRLDVILASAYKLSRTDATTMISDGDVQLNHKVCLNTSKIVSESDIISVRHKGRVYVGAQGGKTKSGRLVIKLGFLV